MDSNGRNSCGLLGFAQPLACDAIDLTSEDDEQTPAEVVATGAFEFPTRKRARLFRFADLQRTSAPPPRGFLPAAEACPPALREELGLALCGGSNGVPPALFAPLVADASSWLLLTRRRLPSGSERFKGLWARHPQELSKAKIYGKDVTFHRYQQAFGASYTFSGQTANAAPLTQEAAPEVFFVKEQLREWLQLSGPQLRSRCFEACLVNWYDGGGHSVGAHSDDERGLVPGAPIFALSWGATRLFRVIPKLPDEGQRLEVELHDGDFLIMGGACQRTHKHAVPAGKKYSGQRISLTFRCFQSQQAKAETTRSG